MFATFVVEWWRVDEWSSLLRRQMAVLSGGRERSKSLIDCSDNDPVAGCWVFHFRTITKMKWLCYFWKDFNGGRGERWTAGRSRTNGRCGWWTLTDPLSWSSSSQLEKVKEHAEFTGLGGRMFNSKCTWSDSQLCDVLESTANWNYRRRILWKKETTADLSAETFYRTWII